MSIKKIAVCRFGAIGDVLHTLPLLYNLKKHYLEQPQAQDIEITYITNPYLEALLGFVPVIDRIMTFETHVSLWSFWQTLRRLEREDFDLVLNLQPSWKSRQILSRLGSGEIREYDKQSSAVSRAAWQDFAATYFEPDSLSELVLEPYLPLLDIPFDLARDVWESFGLLDNGRAKLAIIPSVGKHRAHRQWPIEHWVSFLQMLSNQYDLYLVGGTDDIPVSQAIAARIDPQQIPLVDLTGRLQLTQLAILLSKMNLVIGGDTGPSHLASALGVETLILFGPTSPVRHAPYRGESLRARYECALGCTAKKCVQAESSCMHQVTPSDLYKKVQAMLPF